METARLLVSHYPSGRWICTSRHGDMLTSECDWETSLEFCRRNDTSPEALAKALEYTWPVAMFQRTTEHTTATGAPLFTDRGNRVTFDRVRVSDDEIRLALAHAQQKFGAQLTLTGDDPVFSERMARLADDMGIAILNPELQSVIVAHRATRLRQEPVPVPVPVGKMADFAKRCFSYFSLRP